MTRVQDKVSGRVDRWTMQEDTLTLDMAVQAAEIVPEADWKQNDSAKWVLLTASVMRLLAACTCLLHTPDLTHLQV